MPTRTKGMMYSTLGGYTKDGANNWPHTKGSLGYTQSITSDLPAKAKVILLKEPITRSFYPRCNAVTLSKYTVSATPFYQKFWLYADNRWLEYYDQAGLARLMWVENIQSEIPPAPTQSMKDLALAMAMSRIGDSPFEGAVELGELDETAKFLKRPFADLGELFSRMHKKVDRRIGTKLHPVSPPSRSGKRMVRNGVRIEMEKRKYVSEILADTWLEGRYAAGPLIYSACGIAEAMATIVETLVQNVHSARGANFVISTTVEDKNADWLNDGVNNFRRGTKVVATTKNMAAYVIRYIYYPWMIDAINLARYGISPTQVFSTAWELTPLSFVGDWFVNFGTWLKAMEPKPQCKILDVCYSHKFEKTVSGKDNGGTYSYYSRVPMVESANFQAKREYLKRDIVTNTLTPPTPRLKGKMLTIAQSLDAVALLSRPIQKFFGRFAKFL